MSSDPAFNNWGENPWGFIAEEMAVRGWSMDELANRMGANTPDEWQIDRLTLDFLESIRDPRAKFGEATIQKLSFAFGVSAQFFRDIDAAWLARPDLEDVCATWRAEIDAGLDPTPSPKAEDRQ